MHTHDGPIPTETARATRRSRSCRDRTGAGGVDPATAGRGGRDDALETGGGTAPNDRLPTAVDDRPGDEGPPGNADASGTEWLRGGRP